MMAFCQSFTFIISERIWGLLDITFVANKWNYMYVGDIK